jgi:CHASE2 domain-containing sensor protein
MNYHDLEVKVESDNPPHSRLGSCSRHGTHSDATAALDLAAVEKAIEALAKEKGARIPGDAQRTIGLLLYQGLFGREKVGGLLLRCIGGAEMFDDGGLRINLDFSESPRLARIPWEFVYYPDGERFLASTPATPLVRLMRSTEPNPGLEVPLPVKVLVVCPENAAETLDTEREKWILRKVLVSANRDADPQFLDKKVTRSRFIDALGGRLPEVGEGPFSVVCYIGHGKAEDGESHLCFDGDDGLLDPVRSQWLCDVFRDYRSVKLLVLNSCQGATITGLAPFAGLAPRLVERGVPAVVGMQFPIEDGEALRFAEVFYGALFRPGTGGQVEVALSEARKALLLAYPESRAWGAPVLYMRSMGPRSATESRFAPPGPLFTPVAGTTRQDLPLRRDAQLAQREAARTHLRTIDLLREMPPDKDTSAMLAREKLELARVRRRLWLRAAVISAVVLASAAVTALPVWLFEAILPLESRVESYAMELAGALGDPMDARIVVAPITEATEAVLGAPSDTTVRYAFWRRQHAAAVEALARAGTRVVAFSQYFPDETAGDAAFARAIDSAEARGTRVVLGVAALDGGKSVIAGALRPAAQRRSGILCLGIEQTGTVRIMPLAVRRGGGGATRTLASSLASATVAAYHGDRLARLDTRGGRVVYSDGREERTLSYARLTGDFDSAACPAILPSDTVAEAIVSYSSIASLTDPRHRVEYEEVLGLPREELARRVRGKIVLIGRDDSTDVHTVWHGLGTESRYGYELYADAVNSTLRGALLRPLPWIGQYGIAVLMAALGALVAYASRMRRRRGRLLLLAGIAAIYLAAAIVVTAHWHLLLSVPFHLFALFGSFVLLRWIRRRYDL